MIVSPKRWKVAITGKTQGELRISTSGVEY
jgi:hypothetical protein